MAAIVELNNQDEPVLNQERPFEELNVLEMAKCFHEANYVKSARSYHTGLFMWLIMVGKTEEYLSTHDERKKRYAPWKVYAAWRMLSLFAPSRNPDGTFRWSRGAELFHGMWRHTVRQELKDFFVTQSEYVITETLRVLENYGLIERRHPMRKGTITWRECWIRFRVDKYKQLVEEARIQASRDELGTRLGKKSRKNKTKAAKAPPAASKGPSKGHSKTAGKTEDISKTSNVVSGVNGKKVSASDLMKDTY